MEPSVKKQEKNGKKNKKIGNHWKHQIIKNIQESKNDKSSLPNEENISSSDLDDEIPF